MEWLMENKEAIWLAVTTAISAAAAVAALTPSAADDSLVGKVRKVIDFVGLNVLNAKNEKK